MDLHPENVQDYPRPPALEPVPQTIRIVLAGEVILNTDTAWRVLETHHAPTYYVPRDALKAEVIPAEGSSFCEWKGRAKYWSLSVAGKTFDKIAWSYEAPTPRFHTIKSHLAFYVSRLDSAWVGSAQATAQPGDFYGGWVTPNLQGTVKGGPGTRHW